MTAGLAVTALASFELSVEAVFNFASQSEYGITSIEGPALADAIWSRVCLTAETIPLQELDSGCRMWKVVLASAALVGESDISRSILATDSTGIHRKFSLLSARPKVSGSAPMCRELMTKLGNHSCTFQPSLREASPVIWPTRAEIVVTPSFSDAYARTLSAMYLDCP